MDGAKAIEETLFPGPRRYILNALFTDPERWWSLPDLAGRAGIQTGSVRQHLACLRQAGIVAEKHEGGRAWFQANAECSVFNELRSMMNKLAQKPNGGETILVVEDQPATAQITRILLESWGYRVLEAHSGQEALDLAGCHDGDIHLLLTDVIMPEMNGRQLAEELTKRKPGIRVLFMSGYPADELSGRDVAFLPKPFNPASLSRMVRRELDRRAEGTSMRMKSS